LLEPVTTNTTIETIPKNEVYDEKEELPEFCLTRRGNAMMILSGYRYTMQYVNNNGQRERWVCTSQGGKKCKAVIYTLNNVIMEAHTKHTHPPNNPELFCTTPRGNSILILSKFRYTLRPGNVASKQRWICTSQGSKRCKAAIWTYNKEIIKAHIEHTHPPNCGRTYH
ncbi:Uncharacterized protein OBRU01_23456, partial [Operophtera brumata]